MIHGDVGRKLKILAELLKIEKLVFWRIWSMGMTSK